MRRSSNSLLCASLALGLCGLSPFNAMARDYVVTRTDDPPIVGSTYCTVFPPGGCSLRQAVLAANQNPGMDRIVLGRHTYTLSQTHAGTDGRTGALLITDAVLIEGASSALTRIRWASGLNHSNSVARFELSSGQIGEMKRVTVSHGRGADGGCLYATHALNLTSMVLEQCQGAFGGALDLYGTLTMNGVTFRDNRASVGGAIHAGGWSTIIANDAEFLNNEATVSGGAVTIRGFPNSDGSVMTATWRNEGKSSRFVGNSAPYAGALFVYGNTALNFFSYPATGLRAVFEDNIAVGVGGAVRQWGKSLTLENALFKQNAAASGGAIHADAALVLRDVEFEQNFAQDGVGGALSLPYNPDYPIASIDIDRAAFNGNGAHQGGGAIASECQEMALRNVSFHGNSVVTGRGAAVMSSGKTFMAHMSSAGHASGTATFARTFHTFCGSQPFSWANSVVGGTDSCYSQFGGPIGSHGGNHFGPGASQCQALQGGLDKRHSNSSVFGLSLGTYGGVMEVLGWTADGQSRPQVDFGHSVYCSSHDIRNLPRAGACDSGAFEQQ